MLMKLASLWIDQDALLIGCVGWIAEVALDVAVIKLEFLLVIQIPDDAWVEWILLLKGRCLSVLIILSREGCERRFPVTMLVRWHA